MPLNESEILAATAWIEARAGCGCVLCGCGELILADDVFILRPNVGDSGSGKSERGHHFPLLARICRGCAHTTFFALRCMGIEQPADAAPESRPPSPQPSQPP